ncbi:hypothetical protein [Vulcanisaeta distributa]|uniref:hypothetical protein n=1 Tax=Vulcanisaeta distributa TaxID=164451 RepID=UPI000A8CC608|nr:hypothetical protein [Vulcanisaeta distributa]
MALIALGSIGLYSVINHAIMPSSYVNTDLGLITIGLIYLTTGPPLMIRATRNKDHAKTALPITAIAIGAPPGILMGLSIYHITILGPIITLITLILTILSTYALIHTMTNHGLSTTAMLNMGIITTSLGTPLMLTWSSTAGSIITATGLALTATGLQQHLNKARGYQPIKAPETLRTANTN